MPDRLSTFLIAMAENEETLRQFLDDPETVARARGLSEQEITALKERDAHGIYEQIHREGFAPGSLVWVCPPGGSPRRGA